MKDIYLNTVTVIIIWEKIKYPLQNHENNNILSYLKCFSVSHKKFCKIQKNSYQHYWLGSLRVSNWLLLTYLALVLDSKKEKGTWINIQTGTETKITTLFFAYLLQSFVALWSYEVTKLWMIKQGINVTDTIPTNEDTQNVNYCLHENFWSFWLPPFLMIKRTIFSKSCYSGHSSLE